MPELLGSHLCRCGCGMQLPGSPQGRPCFGCSVGKAEVTFMRDHLAGGGDLRDLLMALQEPVLLEIYGDYTDPRLGRIFRRSKRVMKEFGQHRVVMRSLARTQDADRALRFTECARRVDLFVPVQWALLLHRGPWDLETLLGIGDTFQLERTSLSTCIESIDIQQQIEKDRSHSKEKKVQSIPALFVNGKRVGFDVKSLRRAIRSVVMDTSV